MYQSKEHSFSHVSPLRGAELSRGQATEQPGCQQSEDIDTGTRHTKCAIYARVACLEPENTGIKDQINRCRALADSMGWQILEDHIYCDEGQSGARIAGRPGLSKLLDTVRGGKADFDVILIADSSRISRNLTDVITVHERLRASHVDVYYASQPRYWGIFSKYKCALYCRVNTISKLCIYSKEELLSLRDREARMLKISEEERQQLEEGSR